MRILLALLALTTVTLAQGRRGGDPWERMSRMDEDGDGKVSRDEFRGPDRMFDRFDTDSDGFVTETEAKQASRRRGGGQNRERMTERFDANKDGKVSEAEWKKFFEKADENEDGVLDSGELAAAMSGRNYNDTAPKKDTAAPAIKATDAATRKEFELTRFRRPTVLVFGSWT